MGIVTHIIEHEMIGAGTGFLHQHSPQPEQPAEAPNGTLKTFSTSNKFQSGTLEVFVNGVAQLSGTDFNEDIGNQSYTFAVAPQTGWSIWHQYLTL